MKPRYEAESEVNSKGDKEGLAKLYKQKGRSRRISLVIQRTPIINNSYGKNRKNTLQELLRSYGPYHRYDPTQGMVQFTREAMEDFVLNLKSTSNYGFAAGYTTQSVIPGVE